MLKLKNGYNQRIQDLPLSLTEIHGGEEFYFMPQRLPPQLKLLNMRYDISDDHPSFPPSLTYIRHVGVEPGTPLPPSVSIQELTLSDDQRDDIPPSVQKITFGDPDDGCKHLPLLPPHLTSLMFFASPIRERAVDLPPLPESLTELNIDGWVGRIDSLPPNLIFLRIEEIADKARGTNIFGPLHSLVHLECDVCLIQDASLPPTLRTLKVQAKGSELQFKIGDVDITLVNSWS